jgi:hypothetical protein
MNARADRIFARGALLILGLLFGAAVASASGPVRWGYRPFDVALALVASTIVAEALFVVELLVTGEPLKRPDYLDSLLPQDGFSDCLRVAFRNS